MVEVKNEKKSSQIINLGIESTDVLVGKSAEYFKIFFLLTG